MTQIKTDSIDFDPDQMLCSQILEHDIELVRRNCTVMVHISDSIRIDVDVYDSILPEVEPYFRAKVMVNTALGWKVLNLNTCTMHQVFAPFASVLAALSAFRDDYIPFGEFIQSIKDLTALEVSNERRS